MIDIIKIRLNQGNQAIPDLRKATVPEKFRGLPVIKTNECKNCKSCNDICASNAITLNPLTIDMGKCTFCGDCERECTNNAIEFTNYHKLSSTSREHLIIKKGITLENYSTDAIKVREEIKKMFGSSLKLRQVSAGGCNGCEMELNACSNVNFDMGRFGIEFVASPRHADGLVITGPITENMAAALEDAYICTPDPKIIIAVGTCAISGGVFTDSKAIKRDFLKKRNIDLYVPGCPIHPLTFINGVLSVISYQ